MGRENVSIFTQSNGFAAWSLAGSLLDELLRWGDPQQQHFCLVGGKLLPEEVARCCAQVLAGLETAAMGASKNWGQLDGLRGRGGMKIAFFCEFYPTPRTPFGGAFFHNFAKGLVRLGHEVWVFRFKDLSWGEVKKLKSFYVHDEDIIDGVHVVSHFIPKVPKWTWLNRARLRMLAQKTFSRIQREKSFDVVHLHFSEMFNSLLGLDLAQRYGLPTICTEHSTGLISQGESEQTLVSARKVLEKVAVLATRCGGPERFVREGLDGVIVDPNDNALLEGLNKLVSQEWDLDRSYFMERYSIIAVARVLEGYYRKMVQRTKTC